MNPLTGAMIVAAFGGVVLALSVADTPTRVRAADGRYISWREHRIDDEELAHVAIRGADGLAVGDLDRDGHLDVVSVHEDSSHVRIAFGTEDPDHWLTFTLAMGNTVGAAEDVDLGDLNGDGRIDIVVACERGHLVYFEAPATPRDMTAWKAVIPGVTRRRGPWIRVKLADVDGDGRLEVFGANEGRTHLSYFHIRGHPSEQAAWSETVLWHSRAPINVHPVDLDGDGDLDVVGASRGERKIVWFENLGAAMRWREWPVYEAGKLRSEDFMMDFADLDHDGRLDIVTEAYHGGQVFWLKQPASHDAPWDPHYIGTIDPDHATGLKLVDLNGDGRLDLFVGGYSAAPFLNEPDTVSPHDRSGRLAWFEQPSDPTMPWIRHDVSRRRRGMYDMFVPVDLNRDGLMDLITTRGNSGAYDGVLWLEQVRTVEPVPAFRRARKQDSREVPLPR